MQRLFARVPLSSTLQPEYCLWRDPLSLRASEKSLCFIMNIMNIIKWFNVSARNAICRSDFAGDVISSSQRLRFGLLRATNLRVIIFPTCYTYCQFPFLCVNTRITWLFLNNPKNVCSWEPKHRTMQMGTYSGTSLVVFCGTRVLFLSAFSFQGFCFIAVDPDWNRPGVEVKCLNRCPSWPKPLHFSR